MLSLPVEIEFAIFVPYIKRTHSHLRLQQNCNPKFKNHNFTILIAKEGLESKHLQLPLVSIKMAGTQHLSELGPKVNIKAKIELNYCCKTVSHNSRERIGSKIVSICATNTQV